MADWQQCAAGETAASRDPKRSIGHFSSGGFGVRYKLRGELYFTNDNGQFTTSRRCLGLRVLTRTNGRRPVLSASPFSSLSAPLRTPLTSSEYEISPSRGKERRKGEKRSWRRRRQLFWLLGRSRVSPFEIVAVKWHQRSNPNQASHVGFFKACAVL